MRQVMARDGEGNYTMLKGAARAFVAQSWLKAEGQDEVVPVKETDVNCDKISCDYVHNGHRVLVLKKPSDDEALKALCAEKADILIAWDYLNHDNCVGPSMLIGRGEVETGGAYELWLNTEGIKVLRAQERKDNRLWHP
jgi:hypothetical protein